MAKSKVGFYHNFLCWQTGRRRTDDLPHPNPFQDSRRPRGRINAACMYGGNFYNETRQIIKKCQEEELLMTKKKKKKQNREKAIMTQWLCEDRSISA